MHGFLRLFLLYRVITISSAAICDSVVTQYTIGQIVSILDVPAEAISKLQTPCYKDVIIPGAKLSILKVMQADFGHNWEYGYGGLIGTKTIPVYDHIFIYFGRCSTLVSRVVNVTTGLSELFNSEHLCLHIKPEVEHRSLGGHVKGTKVKLSVRVDIAVCPTVTGTDDIGRCQPLCNSSGVVQDCPTEIPKTNTSNVLNTTSLDIVTNGTTSSNRRTTAQTNTLITSHYNVFIPITNKNTVSLTTNIFSPLVYTPIPASKTSTPKTTIENTNSKLTTMTSSSSRTHSSTFKKKTSTSLSLTSMPSTSTFASMNPTLPLPVFSTRSVTQTHAKSTTDAIKTASITTAVINIRNNTKLPTKGNANATEQVPSEKREPGDTDHIFGLLEGLYVIAGCIFLLLFLGTIAFLVRRRGKRISGNSNTESQRNGFHWRDNWLVRYHNNDIESDSISELASTITCIHGHFLNPPNNELHHSDYTGIITDKASEDPYDDPWPLVRLDSDFVKNTRNLERERSCADNVNVKDNECIDKQYEIYKPDNENNPITEPGSNDEQSKGSGSSTSEHKHQFKTHISVPTLSRGKYDIVKAERSNLKSSLKGQRGRISSSESNTSTSDQQFSKSDLHLIRRESNKKKDTRQRHPSMYSNSSTAFDEILQGEIHNIEEMLSSNCNADSMSNGSDHSRKKNWRVSTLYAIVSSKNGTSPHDAGNHRPSYKRKNASVNRSQSHRTLNDSAGIGQTRLRALSRTSSFHRERDISCIECQTAAEKEANSEKDIHSQTLNDRVTSTHDVNDETVNTNDDSAPHVGENNLQEIQEAPKTKSEESLEMEGNKSGHQVTGISQIEHPDKEIRSIFQQNLEKFEHNGSIAPHTNPNFGTSGTGQFARGMH